MIRTSDRIVSPSRCQTSDVVAGLRRVRGGNDFGGIDAFLPELEAACFEAGVDFAFAAAHCANETDYFRDPDFWMDHNPAGIGHPDNADGGVVFESFRAGARFYVGELLLKLRKPIPSSISDARSYAPEKWDDVKAVVSGSLGPFPPVVTIDDLNTRFGPLNSQGIPREAVWMTDANGPQAICDKGNALLPNIKDQTGVPPPVVGQPRIFDLRNDADANRFGLTLAERDRILDNRFENRRDGGAQGRPRYIILHVQDGTTVGSLDWWANGPNVQGSSTVLVNKDGSIVRCIPEQHGPWTNGDVNQPKPQAAELLALPGNPNIDSLTIEAEGKPFEDHPDAQLDAIEWQCRDWMARYPEITVNDILRHGWINSVDRPNCPGSYFEEVIRRLKATPSPAPVPTFSVPALPEWWDDNKILRHPLNRTFDNDIRFYAGRKQMVVRKATVQRVSASAKGKPSGKDLAAGVMLGVEGSFRNGSGKWVMCSGDTTTGVAEGARVQMKDLTENISVSERI